MRVTLGMLIWNFGAWIAGIGKGVPCGHSAVWAPCPAGRSPAAIEKAVNHRVAEELAALAMEELAFADDQTAIAA